MKGKSKAAAGLFGWCNAINKCYDIFKVVEPKRKNAERMEEESIRKQKILVETKEKLAAINEALAILNKTKNEK